MILCSDVQDRMFLFFFFFSSRRRHTRLTCDWSSDVCSSDLQTVQMLAQESHLRPRPLAEVRNEMLAAARRQSSSAAGGLRSEERRVGKECRSRGSPYH